MSEDKELMLEMKHEQVVPKLTHKQIGAEIGFLVDKKNAAYGDAFGKTAQMLRILYPDGIKLCQYDDLGLIVRMLDKLSRITVDAAAFGESPYADLAGYALLAEARFMQGAL